MDRDPSAGPDADPPPGPAELDLSDDDILDAMREIPGYLDITTQDFRTIYHLAHRHALERLFSQLRAGRLMRTGIEPLWPDMPLDQAARSLVDQACKGLPVTDLDGRVVGILTETDFLRRLKADSFMELLLRLVADAGGFTHRCQATPVREAMTAPAITVTADAGVRDILRAFRAHPGRSMPVVDTGGRFLGLLLRKDFLHAYGMEEQR
jgi:CBS domain-containing membrane protein